MKRFLLLPLLAASIAHAQPVQRPFYACGVSVTFSGIPEKIPKDFIDMISSKGFTVWGDAYFYKSEYDGTMFVESATCMCPEFQIAAGLYKEVNSFRSTTLRGIGNATMSPVENVNGTLKRFRMISLKEKPQCFLQQEIVTNKGIEKLQEVGTAYFDRLLKPLQ